MALCNRTKPDTHFTRPPRTATDFLPVLSGRVLFFFGRPVRISHRRLEAVRIGQNRTQKNRHATVWFDQTLCTKPIREKVWYSLLVSLFGLYRGIAMSPHVGPVAGFWLGWPRGRSGRERPRQGERGAYVGLEYATPHQSAARCGRLRGLSSIRKLIIG